MSEFKSPIPMYTPTRHYELYKKRYEKRMNAVFESGRFINGPEVKELENELAKYTNTKYAIGVSSGTAALEISLMAIGLNPGDEVVTVPFSWISTAEVIRLRQGKVVFCDIESKSYNLDPAKLSKIITAKTRAIIPVNIFGHVCDIDGIKKVVEESEKKFGTRIYIIEDAAQSFGAEYKGRVSCSLGDIGCTSFFPTKPLGGCGDGGMCFTDDEKLASSLRKIKNHGCARRYEYEVLGTNARLDSLNAAFLLSKMADFDETLRKRAENAKLYNHSFAEFSITTPTTLSFCTKHVYAQYTILLKCKEDRDELYKLLKSKEIGCGMFYPVCLHTIKVLSEDYKLGDMPVSEDISSRALSLPVYSELKTEELNYIIKTISLFLSKRT